MSGNKVFNRPSMLPCSLAVSPMRGVKPCYFQAGRSRVIRTGSRLIVSGQHLRNDLELARSREFDEKGTAETFFKRLLAGNKGSM